MSAPTTTPLRLLRRELELRQTDLSAAAGVSRAHLSRVERGLKRASPALRARLAAALGVDPFNQPTEDDS